ncbi:hypothetical protein H6P81_013813 [Aristolochia fimbriata]|uniref:Glycosyltransferase n=1 Tax=Aristolochia fimbriata TaxID=158543 RepID=A0AAV7EHX9_ARIFI|nr:hypothetical protein H6P81_013813 [Aristolochia fimbriata]
MEARDHIILFPFMAQGHLIPFVSLAKLLQRRTNCLVTLLSTPLNVQKFRSVLPPDAPIQVHSLPFDASDHGLPLGAENTDGLPFPLWVRLFHASRALRPAFEQFLSDFRRRHGRPPLCVVADFFLGWTLFAARAMGVYHAVFTTCGAYGTAAFISLWGNLPHTKTEEEQFHLPGFPESFRLERSQMSLYMRAADGNDEWSRFFREISPPCFESDALLCNSVAEMEPFGLEVLRGMMKMPVWCIGLTLPPSSLHRHPSSSFSDNRTGKETGISITDCVEWLNTHPPSSVLYISFGSQNTISETQMLKLAEGLESAGHPFIWVVRPPIGHDVNADFREEWLPEGFEERMRERKQGILVRKWAPQLEILAHESTGAFLSHCGWNSVLESMSQGVPIIAWPLASDQFYNSKMMEEELGVSLELTRGLVAEITVQTVVNVTQQVLGKTEKSADMKKKALVVSDMIRASMVEENGKTGSAINAVDEFMRTARSKH